MKKWVHNRHLITNYLLRLGVVPYVKLKYKYSYKVFNGVKTRPYLILFNHQSSIDHFLLSMCFPKHIYFVGTEDIYSTPYAPILKHLVAIIPFKKMSNDISAIRICNKVAKEGGSIALSPEGNRTYTGKTMYINPSVAKLAKLLKLPIAFFTFHGGYGKDPRWADCVRNGVMRGGVDSVLEYDEYKNWDNDKLYRYICDQLYVDESCDGQIFESSKSAEYLERAIYYCPRCKITHFKSENDKLKCQTCELEVRYNSAKQFEGVNCKAPFANVAQWMDAQSLYVESLAPGAFKGIQDKCNVLKVILYKRKERYSFDSTVTLLEDKIIIDGEKKVELNFDDVTSMALLGRNKLNIYYKDQVLQFVGNKSFNAVKYVNIFYHYKAVSGGDSNVGREFLGF